MKLPLEGLSTNNKLDHQEKKSSHHSGIANTMVATKTASRL